MNRAEILRAIQDAHRGHSGFFQGGNFMTCRRCRLDVKFRDPDLTWIPPRARKERPILTIEDVAATVRS